MKILLTILMAAVPAAAQWGGAEGAAAAGLLADRAEVSVISGLPLTDMLASRDKAALPVTIASTTFLATVVFDDNWDTWFALKPAEGPGAGAWKETDLASGAVYNYKGKAFLLKAADGSVSITSGGEKLEISINALFDKLYADSFHITFGGVITYAAFRNLAPLSENEGTAALRLGSDGLYYYSVTPDAQIEREPRWLLAINWVLYGLRVQDGSLLFVSKPIEHDVRLPMRPERVHRR